MFKEFQIAYHWDEEYYDELQNKIGGGIPKMRYYFGEHGWPHSTLGTGPSAKEAQEAMLNTLQDRKTDIYKDMIRGGTAQVRPGVLRLIDEARTLGERAPKLAICSASTKTSCLFVLDNLLGPQVLQHFDLILAGDDVKNRKPDPEIYRMASEMYVGMHAYVLYGCWRLLLTLACSPTSPFYVHVLIGSASLPPAPSWWRTA